MPFMDLDTLVSLWTLLKSVAPSGQFVALGIIAAYVWSLSQQVTTVKENHLTHVQESLDTLVEQGREQIELLHALHVSITLLIGRSDRER